MPVLNNNQVKDTTPGKFAQLVRREKELDATMINMDRIEQTTATNIASSLIYTLEREGRLVQSDGYFIDSRTGEKKLAKNYYYIENGKAVDFQLIALNAVSIAPLLPHLDEYTPIESVTSNPATTRNFREKAYRNQFIPGVMPKGATKELWIARADDTIRQLAKAGLVKIIEQDGVEYVKHTKRYLSSTISRKGIMHQKGAITQENRRKERVKSRFNAKKDGTAADVREALAYIEAQEQQVNTWLFNAIDEVITTVENNGWDMPKVIDDAMHVIVGCRALAGFNVLNSEYFFDLRGRIYQFAHCGPNPQASDMSKALCYHTHAEAVKKGTEEYDIFTNEFFKEVLGDHEFWSKPAMIRRTAEAPAQALMYAFRENNGELPFKKFFSYMDMCRTWVEFEDKGEATSFLGFGPDAKCSGAQIFSILAGCKDMAEACGLIAEYETKPADPYERSAECTRKLQQLNKNPIIRAIEELTRNQIKTPFMAIQYGGGVPALMGNKDFVATLEENGTPKGKLTDMCGVVIEGVTEALGPQINSFIGALQMAVADYCEEHNVDSFTYRHIDGFQVTKRGEASIMLTEKPFTISIDERGEGVIFGSMENGDGWKIPSITTGPIQRQNFIHYFPVHFVQGIDGVMARKIALESKKQGLKGYSTIHDQFRSCLAHSAKLRDVVIPNVYRDMFINNDIMAHFQEQIDREIVWGNPFKKKINVVTEEILASKKSYYFE